MRYINSLNLALRDLMKNDSNVILLGEDIGEPYGGAFKVTKGLQNLFPDRVIQTPMSESSLPGIGIGLCLEGFKPIIEIMFGDFLTLCVDQIVNHASIFKSLYDFQLPLIVRSPMGGYRGYGATHSKSIEKIFFGVPGVEVVAPNVLCDPGKLLRDVLNKNKPIIFVENKLDYARDIFEANPYLDVNKLADGIIHEVKLKNELNEEIVILSYGGLISPLIDLIWNTYYEEEIPISLFAVNNLSVLDETLLSCDLEDKHIVLVEEGIKYGGFSSEISRVLLENAVRIKSLAVFSAKNLAIGSAQVLENYVLPDLSQIGKYVREIDLA